MSHRVCLASWSLTTNMTNRRGTGGTEDHGIGGLCVRNAPQDRFLGIPRRSQGLKKPNQLNKRSFWEECLLIAANVPRCCTVKKGLCCSNRIGHVNVFIWQCQCSTTMSAAVAPYPSEPRPPVRDASGSTKSLGERCPPLSLATDGKKFWGPGGHPEPKTKV